MSRGWVIVGLGEVLWDLFPDGPRFGGAPANFACHAAALGADVSLVSCVGTDELGDRALDELRQHGVGTDQVGRCEEHPTGTVEVRLDAAGKPTFRISNEAAWDHLGWTEALSELAARADAVCFGTLGQRGETSRQTIHRFLAGMRPESLRVFDINFRAPYFDEAVIRRSLDAADVLKLNDEELPVLAGLHGLAGSEAEVLFELARRHDLRAVALTRGSRGALLVRGPEVSECPGVQVEVRDTVGAGDAFTAALTLGLLQGFPLDTINRHACRVAAFVCTQPGGTPRLPEELREPGED
jgi:fructokinase